MATSGYSLAADHYIDRGSNRQEKIRGPCKGPFFILFSPQTNFSFWSLRSPACSDLLTKVTWESYMQKLHRKVTFNACVITQGMI